MLNPKDESWKASLSPPGPETFPHYTNPPGCSWKEVLLDRCPSCTQSLPLDVKHCLISVNVPYSQQQLGLKSPSHRIIFKEF